MTFRSTRRLILRGLRAYPKSRMIRIQSRFLSSVISSNENCMLSSCTKTIPNGNIVSWSSTINSPYVGVSNGATNLPSRLAIHSNSYFSTDSSSSNSNNINNTSSSTKESLEFQAETRQLLDIVTHSLYTDKEVFLRELVSNASDALEKLRHLQAANHKGTDGETDITDPEIPLEIRLETDETNNTLTITDTGIGLTREEMVSNLGTIARSGSKAFMNELATLKEDSDDDDKNSDLASSTGIIGKFGVGFYSAFMVADKVEVRSKTAYQKTKGGTTDHPLQWSSSGIGSYDIEKLDGDDSSSQSRGASVILHLRDDHKEYAKETRVEEILKKYSNFVNFPILLNGKRVNTLKAIWADDPSTLSKETYSEFYKYIANASDEPMDTLHYRADAPLEIKALFYIPSFHTEKYGMGRMDPGVSLYSRKVLIEPKSPHILPEWMRFIRGVVDSEDLPLSISREKAQDSALIGKLRRALTRKFINHLTTMARKNVEKFRDEFYKEYSFFLKEGICHDYEFQQPLSKLLYYETNKTINGQLCSLEEYVSRCKPEQKEIYYLCAPSRELALQSPYLEAFDKAGREVIFLYSAVDEFVMINLDKFQDRSLISAEKSNIDLGEDDKDQKDDAEDKEKDTKDGEKDVDKSSTSSGLSDKEATDFCAWFQMTIPTKVSSCKTTNRLSSSPAVITDNESGATRRMMRMLETVDTGGVQAMPLPPQQVEINPNHPIIAGINAIRDKDPELAKVCAEQIYDNCLVAAGLLDDGRSMLGRLNDLLLCVVKGAESQANSSSVDKESVADHDNVSMNNDKENKP